MSEFNDRPFVAGSLTGTRSFRIDHLGRLTGVSYQKVWRPGENLAYCHKSEFSLFSSMSFSFYLPKLSTTGTTEAKPAEPEPEPVKTEHRPGSKGCECGYYAYFDDGHNPYHGKRRGERYGAIRGLIEGYGLAYVGTRGFRCEKARILALVIPPKKAERDAFTLVRRNYPDLPFYESHAEALAAHPLTPPPAATPETCPEFWLMP